jgi:hypothetical protein
MKTLVPSSIPIMRIKIVFSDENNIGYVTHKGSNPITIFNGTDNKLLYFAKFQMSPENAGKVNCGDKVFGETPLCFSNHKPNTVSHQMKAIGTALITLAIILMTIWKLIMMEKAMVAIIVITARILLLINCPMQ